MKSLDVGTVAATAGIAAGIAVTVEAGKALYQFFDESIQKASAYEEEMAAVVKVTQGMRDATGNYTDLYYNTTKEIMDIGAAIPVDIYELPETAAAILQDGTIGIEGLVPALEDASKAGIALDTTLEESARMLSTWRLNLHLSEPEVYDMANAVNYLGENSGRTPAEIADMVSALSGVAEIGGIGTNQLIAMAAAIPGIDPSRAATSMKNFIIALEKGESATKRQRDALKKLGFDASDFAKQVINDPVAAIDEFADAFNELQEYEQLAILNDFGGQRAVEGLGIFLNNIEQYRSLLADLENGEYEGSIEREVESRSNTAEGAKTMYENSNEAMKIQVGEALLPLKTEIYKEYTQQTAELRDSIVELANSLSGSDADVKDDAKFLTGLLQPYIDMANDLINDLTTVNNFINSISESLGASEIEWGEWFSKVHSFFVNLGTSTYPLMDALDYIRAGIAFIRDYDMGNGNLWQSLGNFILRVTNLQGLFDSVLSIISKIAGYDISGTLGKTSGASKTGTSKSQKSKSAYPKSPQELMGFASGGFTSVPSIFGEAGLEAAISFNPAYRSENIGYWAEAGQRLGVLSEENPFESNSGGDIIVNVGGVKYDVNVREGTRENVVRALRDSEPEFADMLYDILTRMRRSRYDSADCGI